MADEADIAQQQMELMEEIRNKAIIARRPIKRAYDWCIDCGDRIDPRRLKIVPDAERCSDCQQDFEVYLRRSE